MNRRLPLAALALMALLTAACAGRVPAAATARVLQLSDDARASVREQRGIVLVELHTRSGIGGATFEFIRPARGARFVLHTRGLEQFRLAFGDVVVELAVAQDGTLRQTAARGRGSERRLDARDPLWMPVRVVRADRGRVPGGGGLEAVEIETPPEFTTAMPPRCGVSWIDFFR